MNQRNKQLLLGLTLHKSNDDIVRAALAGLSSYIYLPLVVGGI